MRKIDLKRTIVTAAAGATMFAFSALPLLSHSFTIEFFSNNPQLVDLSIESIDVKTGDFSGEAVSSNALWEVTGTVVGNKMELELINLKDEGRIVATGEINKDGTIIGKAASHEGELFEWEASDALVAKANS